MNSPPDDEMPGSGFEMCVGKEAVEACPVDDRISAASETSGELANVALFRPFVRGRPHPFEIVETFKFDRFILVSVAGPWTASPHEGGERKPWQMIGRYPIEDARFAAARAEMLSEQMGIPIVDLAEITASPHPLARKGEPEAV